MKYNQSKKSENVKGFYIALGISALMIGSACYFSYKEGNSNYEEVSSQSESSQYVVDKKETNIPKSTTELKNSYVIVTTTQTTTATIPPETSAVIVETESIEEVETETEPELESETEINENLHQPLRNALNIINDFSGKDLVKNITTGSWQTHNGTDYSASIGEDVFAVCDGTVVDVENDPLWGTVVILKHSDGVISRYCNLSKDLSVQKGISISAGDIIGSIGDTADIESSLEPHLHIEFLRGGEYVNPSEFIS